MQKAIKIILILSIVAIFASSALAKSWRGITPLKSNRKDVARILNVSIDPSAGHYEYESPTEVVEFVFSGTEDYLEDCVKKLSPGTVLLIEISPRIKLQLKDIGLGIEKLKHLESSAEFIINREGYADEDQGLVVTLSEGYVRKIVYVASTKDRHLCEPFYSESRRFTDRILCILCPTIAVTCADSAEAGVATTFTVNVSVGTPAPTLTYHWTVSAGTITKGQNTSSIEVDTTNLAGKTVTATVEVGGIDPACSKVASCETPIVPRKN